MKKCKKQKHKIYPVKLKYFSIHCFFREWGRMLRNIYVQRDKKIFQDIKHFADIITDQIGFRLVTVYLHFSYIITDQIGFRLVTGYKYFADKVQVINCL